MYRALMVTSLACALAAPPAVARAEFPQSPGSLGGVFADIRTTAPIVVTTTPRAVSPLEATLLNQLEAARHSGDRAAVRTWQGALDALYSTGPVDIDTTTASVQNQEIFAGGEQDADGRWTGDVRITLSDIDSYQPAMVAAPSGILYAAVEQADGWIYVYRSADGGASWAWIRGFKSADTSYNPALTYAETAPDDNWAFVAYEGLAADSTKSVWVYRFDPESSDPGTFHMLASNIVATPDICPRICTDTALYSYYYVYVTYAVSAIDYFPAMFTRSTDFGVTWTTPQNVTGGAENSQNLTRPDITYGSAGLFIAFEKLGWTGSTWDVQPWVTNSINYGSAWSTPTQLLDAGPSFHPSVASAVGNDAVLVAYTRDYSTDTDVHYAYSLDGGTMYNLGYALPWTFDDEDDVDLAVSPAPGRFHAAYRHVNDIWVTHSDTGTPGTWAPTVLANDTGTASVNYPLPSICTDPTKTVAYQACVAWTDFRAPYYGAYFDWAGRCTGDLNCDGLVDFGDINPFVLYMSNLPAWQAANPTCAPANGDINGDGTYGQASFGDINPFVAIMQQCGPQACVCP